MHRLSTFRYFVADLPKVPKMMEKGQGKPTEKKEKKKVKENMKPVKIDFALPDTVVGI